MSTKKDKTNSLVTCKKCRSSVTNKTYLKCNTCKATFDTDCALISSKRLQTMTKSQQTKWKCQDCQNKILNTTKNTDPNTIQTNTTDTNIITEFSSQNITLRQKKEHKQTQEIVIYSHSDNEDSSFLSINSNLRSSLPDLSTRVNEDVSDLKQKIQELSLQLESAHLEIDNLTLEKNALLEKISHQEIKLNTLSAMNTPISIKKKKAKLVPGPSGSQRLNQNSPVTNNQCTKVFENDKNDTSPVATDCQAIPPKTLTTEEDTQKTISEHDEINNNKIYIYGTQQTSGLALALLKSRENSKYKKYIISSSTKPFADSKEVLKGCYTDLESTKDSCKFIFCIGENDSNPVKVITELSAILKRLENCSVLVLNIVQNPHLNEKLLNNNLRIICNTYKNCHFIENSYYYMNYLTDICNKINFCIDYIDYRNLYLDVKSIKRRLQLFRIPQPTLKFSEKLKESKLKQKTILDYFTHKETKDININKNNFFRS